MRAAVWPEKLCYAILRGLRKQLCSENTMNVGELGTVSEDATEKQFTRSLGDAYFVDDVSGKKLESESVLRAREDERKGVVRHNVFTKVPIQECFDKTGGAPVSTKWIDINKGDDEKLLLPAVGKKTLKKKAQNGRQKIVAKAVGEAACCRLHMGGPSARKVWERAGPS